ncbi:MAG: preprotein translocase subunit SecA [Elusimicrobiota bacterium]
MFKLLMRKIFGSRNERELKKIDPFVQEVNALEGSVSMLSDNELRAKTDEFKKRFADGATLDDLAAEAFACVREASKRTIGLRHFDVQILGGMVLHQGKIAEMRTGEGKTLVATLPVYLNSLTGKGVHVVTVNDYLAKRDSEWMGPVYKFLGLTIGVVQHDINHEERKNAYACDVTYITNNELGFDYLRDNMVTSREEKVLRNQYYAIVDEVDSILVDEARTPLIISGPAEMSTEKYYIINRIVPSLKGRFVTESEQIDAKYNNIDLSVGFDYLVDEKAHTATLTAQGVANCERMLSVKNLYDDIQSEWVHHINQALRAHNLFKRDVDYVVNNGEVVIVDEFTGRLMPGRRWSDGLHQAVEAKENVKIARENQTLATITFQNFFKMYEKLAGMTGTAVTEAEEFWHIYKLDVLEIPTNQPIKRIDNADVIYRTEREKYSAIVNEIEELNRKGSPVLVGTRSIEKSEKLAHMLKRKGVPHQVLNAKYHEMEAHIIAQAGKKGAVTIATNMAGRGTDIVLGGNPSLERDREDVLNAGGLHIIGTERHDSRRIDNQLRGRSGRQGDPGSTRFYLGLDDELMRLFGSERISMVMQKLGMQEGEDIQHPWISKAIESAQRKVEGMNFDIRKQLLEYDNVMNKQREVVYTQRNMLLESESLRDSVNDLIDEVWEEKADAYMPKKGYNEAWDLSGLNDWIERVTGNRLEDIELYREKTREESIAGLNERLKELYKAKELSLGEEVIKHLERMVMLQVLDNAWKEHLYNLDQVKRGIGLRAYGQKDPLIEYQHESFNQFMSMIARVKEETVEYLFRASIVQEMARPIFNQMKAQKEEAPTLARALQEHQPIFQDEVQIPQEQKPHTADKIGRNDPCPCGSGKKYKKCCGK